MFLNTDSLPSGSLIQPSYDKKKAKKGKLSSLKKKGPPKFKPQTPDINKQVP